MILFGNKLADETIKLSLPVILMVLAGIAFLLCVAYFLKIMRQQFKLHNSITLVELRQPKLFFMIIAGLVTALMVSTLILAIRPTKSVMEMLNRIYGLDIMLVRLVFIALTIILGSVAILMIQMVFSRAAIVDRGVYLGSGFIDWHHIYDYHVDEERCCVILSANKLGPLTLSGTTSFLKFDENDIDRIRFILNKNKNKFIPRYELR